MASLWFLIFFSSLYLILDVDNGQNAVTSNQMTAVLFVSMEPAGDNGIQIIEHEITGSSYNPAGSVVGIDKEEAIKNRNGAIADACDIMSLCNDARLIGSSDSLEFEESIIIKDGKDTSGEAAAYTIEGEPTEAALLCLVEKLGPLNNNDNAISPAEIASRNCRFFADQWDRYATLEFDRKRKSMVCIINFSLQFFSSCAT